MCKYGKIDTDCPPQLQLVTDHMLQLVVGIRRKEEVNMKKVHKNRNYNAKRERENSYSSFFVFVFGLTTLKFE